MGCEVVVHNSCEKDPNAAMSTTLVRLEEYNGGGAFKGGELVNRGRNLFYLLYTF